MKAKDIMAEEIGKYKTFGFSVMFFDICARMTKKSWFYIKKHQAILSYLEKKYDYILSEYQSRIWENEKIADDCPIWVFWYQGFENAPELVKMCLESLRKNAGNHPIIELSKDNYKKYIEIPNYIEEKLKRKCITITQFSDILRVSLLAKYGGCWTDATILFCSWLHDDICKYSWYSLKQKNQISNSKYVSDYKWSAFFQVCSEHSNIAGYMRDIFYAYWNDHEQMIDYFLIDYFFALGYHNISSLKTQIDDVPVNNPNISWLQKHLKDNWNEKKFDVITQTTAIFKLDWRIPLDFDKGTYGDKLRKKMERE